MDFFECINFDKELTENEYCTITYSGDLFKNNSDVVSIVYGYDENWAHTTEQKMNKTDNGFVVDIKLRDGYGTLYFCFKNSYNQWDNNNYQNYWAPINKQVEKTFIINENVIQDILNNLVKDDLDKIKPLHIKHNLESPQTEALNVEESVANSADVNSLDTDIDNIFNDIYEENSTDKKDLLDNILSSSNNKVEEKVENIQPENNQADDQNNFNVNSLINEILSPIVSSSVFEEENLEDLENLKVEEKNDNDKDVDSIVDKETVSTDSVEDLNTNLLNYENDSDKDFNLDNEIDLLISNLYNNVETDVNNSEKFENLEETITEKESNEFDDNTYENSNVENVDTLENDNIENVNTLENDNIENIDTYENENYDNEESLIDAINNDIEKNEEKALIEVPTDNFIVSSRALSKFYLFKKKIKLAFYKLFVGIPKLLNGNLNEDRR